MEVHELLQEWLKERKHSIYMITEEMVTPHPRFTYSIYVCHPSNPPYSGHFFMHGMTGVLLQTWSDLTAIYVYHSAGHSTRDVLTTLDVRDPECFQKLEEILKFQTYKSENPIIRSSI